MKKLYTTALMLVLALGAFAQYGQIANGGFENWSDIDLYDFPSDWQNSNVEEFQGTATVFQSTDAQDGTYSCELRGEAIGSQDAISGYVYQGATGAAGPSGGIPYTANFDELQYHYTCDLMPGDTFFVVVSRFIAGVNVGTTIIDLATGNQPNWTSGSVSFPNGAQDEIFVGFVLGNPFDTTYVPTDGSWARVDNISMHNAGIEVTNLPDPSFENWTNVSTEEPDNWFTINPYIVAFGQNAVKSTDANSGSFAIEMSTTSLFGGADTIASFLSIGTINLSSTNPFALTPYDAVPDSLIGSYKYAPSMADQAFIQVIFYQSGNIIGFETQVFNASSTWQNFNLPITIAGTPDSLSFIAYSGDNAGSILLLDDLQFIGGDVGLDEFSSMNVAVYPNPASDKVLIKADGTYQVSIVNLSGQIVITQNDVVGSIEMNLSELSRGAYFINIRNDFKAESHKLIIE